MPINNINMCEYVRVCHCVAIRFSGMNLCDDANSRNASPLLGRERDEGEWVMLQLAVGFRDMRLGFNSSGEFHRNLQVQERSTKNGR